MKKLISSVVVACLFVLSQQVKGQSLVINEFMSNNDLTIEDAFGVSSDWIEIYNNSASAIDLSNYCLSDEPLNLTKWKFPQLMLQPGAFLLVFASAMDTIIEPVFWSTKIDREDQWKYFVGKQEPPTDWKGLAFNDATWKEGSSGFGYCDGDDATFIDTTISFYCRKTFNIDNINTIDSAVFHIDYDDGFIAYLNGVEIARSNMTGTNPPFNQGASASHEALIKDGYKPEKFKLTSSMLANLHAGPNVLAIQVHNTDIASSDMPCVPFFSLKYSEKPEILIPPADLLNLQSHDRNIHTNFKIDANGEVIYLSSSTGVLIHTTESVKLINDQSYGRSTNGSPTWKYFDFPSPGKSNNLGNSLHFSHQRGYYTEPINLTITSDNGDTVYCTYDGNLPTDTSVVCSGTIVLAYLDTVPNYFSEIPTTQNIKLMVMKKWESPKGKVTKTHIVRCRSYKNGEPTSPVYSQTYFIDSNAFSHYTMPLISLITAPGNLFDYYRGIYVPGQFADSTYERTGNFYQAGIEWERPVHIEYFETNGQVGFSQDAGMRIHGLISRQAAQKTLRLYARSEYGKKNFNYPLLPQKDIGEYKRFILRTPMSSWGDMFHDAFVHNIMRNLNMEVQDYRAVIVFLNGEYWGIHNLRDYVDENYLASLHAGVDKNKINLLQNNSEIVKGTNTQYNSLINYINTHELAIQENYDYVKTKIDINNYIDYTLAEMYANNHDWPGNNIRYWQADNNGKWRWIFNDLDASFWSPEVDMFPFVSATNGPDFPNPPWSTFLFRNFIKNDQFKHQFVCRATQLMESVFNADTIEQKIQKFKQEYEPELEEYISRWHFPGETIKDWKDRVNSGISYFARSRQSFFTDDMIKFFKIENIEEYCLTNLNEPTTLIDNSELIISPNPSEGVFQIQLPYETKIEGNIYLFSITGQLVYTTNISSVMNYMNINASSMAKGVYLVKACINNTTFNSKIIIK